MTREEKFLAKQINILLHYEERYKFNESKEVTQDKGYEDHKCLTDAEKNLKKQLKHYSTLAGRQPSYINNTLYAHNGTVSNVQCIHEDIIQHMNGDEVLVVCKKCSRGRTVKTNQWAIERKIQNDTRESQRFNSKSLFDSKGQIRLYKNLFR